MPLPDFKSSEPFTLGIELELQVVNPPGYDLSQDSSALIAAVKDDIKGGEVKHDITESMLEIATGVCQNIDQAAAQFSVMQQSILRAAAEQHIQICGGGTHPFQKWQRQEVAIRAALYRPGGGLAVHAGHGHEVLLVAAQHLLGISG